MSKLKNKLSRRKALNQILVVGASCALPSFSFASSVRIAQRVIPSSGQKIGIVGLGTWQTFDVGNSPSAREPLKEVLKVLTDQGGNLIDSSPMYGSSEKVVGDLTKELNIKSDIFYATKVWTSGEQSGKSQMQSSMQKMGANPMDLMQIHNLMDWKTHMKTLYDWKEKGLIKHIGITHYVNSAHSQLEQIIKNENIDFVQVNFSINDRHAEESLLGTAKDNGVAVLINRPYAGGSLFRNVKGKNLPDWAPDIDCSSWGQYFLKYILSNPAITCVIPGTSKPHHMKDNMGAGFGRMADENTRKKMITYLNNL